MEMPVHLVLVNQYYPPDEAPTGLMLEAVAEVLVEAGHQVTVLCAEGGYAGAAEKSGRWSVVSGRNEGDGPTRVIRIGATKFGRGSFVGKLADYASFYLGVGWKLLTLHPKPDRVVVLTTPPYLSVLARIATKFRGADHAHWVMDLYPDVMVAHGMLREGGLPHRLLASLARFGFGGKRCAAVVTLGPDMAERVSRHLPAGKSAAWVPLWGTEGEKQKAEDGKLNAAGAVATDQCRHRRKPAWPLGKPEEELEADGRTLRCERGWADDELILMYSGNMGLGHRFGEFLAAAAALCGADHRSPIADHSLKVRFVFYGGGKRRGEIEDFIRQHPDAPVELHDYVPRHQLAAHLRSADVHLASLEPAWTGTMLPSKLQGIFAVGRPVIFVGDAASSTAAWIKESGGGWVVPANDVDGLLGALVIAGTQSMREERGQAASSFQEHHFDKSDNVARLARLFGTVDHEIAREPAV